jgi:DNA-binding SARP family transcriptional activator
LVKFRLLGPLEAAGDAGPVKLAGGKQNALLAVLLLHADQVVPMDRLVDDLWGEDVPESAQKMVQIFVSQLRKQLPDGLLQTRAPGYRIALDGHSLDVRDFEQLSTSGRDALRHGRVEEAATTLRRALALSRGPALAEFQEPFAAVDGGRLAEQQLACLEDRIDADLALGRHHELVAELDALVRRHPLRERLRGQLMLALYRAGRHAEALESYRAFRRLLGDGLGIDPPTRLKELERRILKQDPALATPRHGDATPGDAAGPRRSTVAFVAAPAEPVVGRERELAHLEGLLREAQSGRRRLVFVSGEPGIGKTAIVDAFLARLDAPDELLVARGQCVEHRGAGEPYLPVLEAIGGLCRRADGERIVRLLAQRAPTWLAQMPWHISEGELASIHSRIAGATHERMLREMLETAEAIGAEAPLVLFLEDLHWSDASTIELLEAIAKRREAARLLVIGTYRRGDAIAAQHVVHRTAQALRARALCTELAVGQLAEEAVAEYVATRAPAGTPAGVPRLLHQRTDGHPLFVKLLLDSWLEHGLLDRDADLADLAADVPDSVRELIEQMLLELGPDDQELLEAASVAGRAFSAATVAAAIEQDEAEIELRCDRLAKAKRFLGQEGDEHWPDGTVASRFAFSHDLHREVLYGRLPAGRRATLHRRVGLRLDAAYGARAAEIATELADHFVEGGDAGRAVVSLRLAGEQALHRLAHPEALEHLQRGLQTLDRLDDGPDRWTQEFALQSMLGAVLIATRGWASPDAEAAFLRARELAETQRSSDELGRILFLLGTLYDVRGEYARSERLLEEALSLSGRTLTGGVLTDSHELLACSLFHQGGFDAALRHAEHGLAATDGSYVNLATAAYGDNPGIACHSWAALSLWFLGYPDRARERAAEAVALAADPARRHGQATALVQAAVVSQCCGDVAATRASAEAALEAATRDGYRYRGAMATILRGWALAGEGGAEDAIFELRRGLELSAATGARMDDGYLLALLADACLRLGRVSEAAEAVEAAIETTSRERTFFYEAELHRLRGEVSSSGDAPDELAAEKSYRCAVEIARDLRALSLQLRATLSLGKLLARGGRAAEARALVGDVYDRFTEGFETSDLVEARALIQELED